MTFLPIVERELRIAARLTSTYRNRAIIAAVVALVAMVMFTFGAFSPFPAQTGRAMFWTLTYMAIAFCLLEGVRKTADCLSEEKRDGTLGLLFLTDLKGYDVILGKLTARSLNSVYGLLSVLPIMALALLLGGTTIGEYWRVALALANLLFFSLCVGIFVSLWCRDERQAMTTTLLVILIWVSVPLFVHSETFSPLFAIRTADAKSYAASGGNFWSSLLLAQLFSWVMLLWASLAVSRCWREEKTQISGASWWRQWTSARRQNAEQRARMRTQMLEANPAFWLAGRDSSQRAMTWIFIAIAAALSVGMIFFYNTFFWGFVAFFWLLNFAVKMRVASQACHCFAEARRTNAIEMLLVTPLSTEQIVYGQILALQHAFTKPIAVIFLLEIAGLILGFSVWHTKGDDDVTGLLMMGTAVLCYLGFFALDMVALTWTGMELGLSSKKESQAVAKTVIRVLILPLCCTFMFCYGVPFIIGIPLVCLYNSRVKLRHEFRKLAGQPYAPPQDQGWIPGALAQPASMQPNAWQ